MDKKERKKGRKKYRKKDRRKQYASWKKNKKENIKSIMLIFQSFSTHNERFFYSTYSIRECHSGSTKDLLPETIFILN